MRIAIVNDTMMAVEGLRRLLVTATDHELAWVAVDGGEAVKRCQQDLPDLILMDLVMPVLNGIEATRQIMASTPCPILIVTSSVDGHSAMVFEAMGAGALDVVKTPVLRGDGDIKDNIALLNKIKTIEKLTKPIPSRRVQEMTPAPVFSSLHKHQPLVVIGASTGGPPALAKVLSALPANFSAGIVIIQHIDAHFSHDLANWLGTQCDLRVKIAEDGDCITPGVVLLASTNDHLIMSRQGNLTYTPEPLEMVYRPSVDVFFESVAAHWGGEITAVLLTGMGRDGAAGLLSLCQKGVYTIAQDQESCAVYGMPKAAAALNAAVDILPLDSIAATLLKKHHKLAMCRV